MAQPRRNEPRKIPQKLAIDMRRETTVNFAPATVYTSTDLEREGEKILKGHVTGSGWSRGGAWMSADL